MFWKRLDDGFRPGYAEVREQARKTFGSGEVVSSQPDAIHSVVNETRVVTLSLHVYGRHLNHVERFQFDPVRCTSAPIKLSMQ